MESGGGSNGVSSLGVRAPVAPGSRALAIQLDIEQRVFLDGRSRLPASSQCRARREPRSGPDSPRRGPRERLSIRRVRPRTILGARPRIRPPARRLCARRHGRCRHRAQRSASRWLFLILAHRCPTTSGRRHGPRATQHSSYAVGNPRICSLRCCARRRSCARSSTRVPRNSLLVTEPRRDDLSAGDVDSTSIGPPTRPIAPLPLVDSDAP